MGTKLKVAVITEWHPFDVMSFQHLLWRFDDIDAYVQSWDLFTRDENRDVYDVALYYNMSFPAPPEDDPRRRYIEEGMGRTEQGIVLLHHAILSYRTWSAWNAISGTTDRSFKYFGDQRLDFAVADPGHPITTGIGNFSFTDESYTMAEPDPDNHVLITTEHQNSLRAIAWVREYGNSRVFCYQSGHDNAAWSSSSFQEVLHRGIHWAARRIG